MWLRCTHNVIKYQSIRQYLKVETTAAGLYKRIYYLIMPRPKVHGHVTNENGAIACIIEFDNGFVNCA